jgi:tetratricopeptide (TPR) repeat protein
VGRYLDEALTHSDPWTQATGLAMRARFAENSGDIAAVQADTTAALAAYEQAGDELGRAAMMPLAATLLTYAGQLPDAVDLLTDALRLLDDRASDIDTDDRLFNLMRLADLHTRLADVDAADRYAQEAMGVAEATGPVEWTALARVVASAVRRAFGDLDQARQWQRQAEDELAEPRLSRFAVDHGAALVAAAGTVLDVEAGDLDAARRHVATAYAAGRSSRDMPIAAMVAVAQARLVLAEGDPARAAWLLGAAARLRGADDPTDPTVAQVAAGAQDVLGADGYRERWSVGREMSTAEALDRSDPALG